MKLSPATKTLFLDRIFGIVRGNLALFTTFDGDKRIEPRELTAPFERVPVVLRRSSHGLVNVGPLSLIGSGEVVTHVGIFDDDGVLMIPLVPIEAKFGEGT